MPVSVAATCSSRSSASRRGTDRRSAHSAGIARSTNGTPRRFASSGPTWLPPAPYAAERVTTVIARRIWSTERDTADALGYPLVVVLHRDVVGEPGVLLAVQGPRGAEVDRPVAGLPAGEGGLAPVAGGGPPRTPQPAHPLAGGPRAAPPVRGGGAVAPP